MGAALNQTELLTLVAIARLGDRENSRSLAELAAYTEGNANLTGEEDPERVRAAFAHACCRCHA